MNVRVQQLNPTIGDIDENVASIKKALSKAVAQNITLLILPELTVCGYPPMDLLERNYFLEVVYKANTSIVDATNDTAVIFGTITPNTSGFGRKCFNSAIMAYQGKIIAEAHKTLLPTYDIFDDLRYFEPNGSFSCAELQGHKLGVTICEDIWYNKNDIQYHTYEINPAQKLVDQGAEAIINISASPYTKNKPESRKQMLQNHAKDLNVPIFYANQVGANTDIIFDGDSMVVNPQKEVVARAPLFKQAFIDVAWDNGSKNIKKLGSQKSRDLSKIGQMFNGLVLGVKDYLRKTGVSEQVILGLSGGIDSALVTCIAVEALGAENVTGVTMPSDFSSDGSISDSKKLADNLDTELHQLAIKDIYDQFTNTLHPLFKDTSFDVAEENLQPRIRGMILMAYSNKFGPMLLNTGNKSELATGYCTLYGDMAGGLGVIADLYKTEVYEMAHWLNNEYYKKEMIPNAILTKPPSAELRPNQKDSDTLPDYDILDPILEAYIEKQYSNTEIIERGFQKSIVNQITKLVDQTEFKRFQAAPGLKISEKAFGLGRRWPIVQRWSNQKA